MKIVLKISLLITFLANSQVIGTRHNTVTNPSKPRTERYVTNSPFNGIGTSVVVDYTEDSTKIKYFQPELYFPRYAQTINSTAPASLLSIRNSDGLLVRHSVNYYSKGKTDSTYIKIVDTLKYNSRLSAKFNNPTGTPLQYVRGDGSLGSLYSVAPNIQANPVGGSTEIFLKIVSISTTGFTVNVFQRANVLSLALSTATTPVSGASVDVLVTEK